MTDNILDWILKRKRCGSAYRRADQPKPPSRRVEIISKCNRPAQDMVVMSNWPIIYTAHLISSLNSAILSKWLKFHGSLL